MIKVPSYNVDFYSDEFIREPWPHYARMRDLGPVVWLSRHENFALTRHREVSQALRDHETFISGRGVAADEKANELTRGNSAASDGERHTAIRAATSPPLLPGALNKIKSLIDAAAEGLIEKLVRGGQFDAAKDLAPFLPLTIVCDLVGLPDYGRENMLRWANATFDLLGVQNERGKAAVDVFLEQRRFAQSQANPVNLKPGSWTRRLFDLVERGELAADLAPVAMRDYLNPSLDTTISATGQLIYQFGTNPEQWDELRSHPNLARQAVNEAVRMASPVRTFSRHTSRAVKIGEHEIPSGARVMMLYASANRDERVFPNPDKFDITRNPREHVGFGSGIHMCVGMHLAQMEMIALLEAMIPRVSKIEVARPTVGLNNTIYHYSSLLTLFVPTANFANRRIEKPAAVVVEGAKTIDAVVLNRRDVADGIIALKIKALDGKEMPDWTAGSHIDVYVREGVVRQYSLIGPRRRDVYEIAVQLDPNSKGGSVWIHDRVKEGSTIVVSPPRNHFPLIEAASEHLLFSGGIGLTPHSAMAWHLHEVGAKFVWHISARTRSRLAWGLEIDALPFRSRIHVHLDDGEPDQRLHALAEIRRAAPGSHVYLCGPRGYMDYVRAAAGEAGFPEDRIHQELFSAEISVDGDPFTVITQRSGKKVTVGEHETILAALDRVGIKVETSCRNGVCGSCLTRVIQGRPDHRDMVLTATEKAENDRIAVCCSRSQTATLVLDI